METSASFQQSVPNLERFLVCGLGSLGQCCVVALKNFGVSVVAIELVKPDRWEIANLPDLLDELIIGDCSENSILEEANIYSCRAALLVTSNERINIETALAIHQLNPHTRLVVRSAKENLNELLSQQISNFIAYDSTQLPATAFALAAFDAEVLGLFQLDGKNLQVVRRYIDDKKRDRHATILGRSLYDLISQKRQILTHSRHGEPLCSSFYQWNLEEIVDLGDTLVCLEIVEQHSLQFDADADSFWQQQIPPRRSMVARSLGYSLKLLARFFRDNRSFREEIANRIYQFWQFSFQQRVRQIVIIYCFILLLLLPVGTLLFHANYPDISWLSAFSMTAILLLGGYGDVFGNLSPPVPIPWWLQLFSLLLALVGTAFVGVLYALITEALLSLRFQFVKRRPKIPPQNHVAIVGMDRIGQQVATLLQEFHQPLVAITFHSSFERETLMQIPIIVGNIKEALAKANLSKAKSMAILTDDEIFNLEVALMARSLAPNLNLVIRTCQQHLNERFSSFLPNAQVLFPDATAAEVFVGAAFGEKIINLFHLNNQTILVTEYRVESGDTLNDLLISEVACGYGVIPVLHQKFPQSAVFFPSEDLKLSAGDRLVVLATIDALQRVERGATSIYPKQTLVRIDKALTSDAVFDGANTIARISGYHLSLARNLMNSLPQTLPLPLYKHQAQRLVRELRKILVQARIVI
jgi:Trk K+ transport system NAD-binding subunit